MIDKLAHLVCELSTIVVNGYEWLSLVKPGATIKLYWNKSWLANKLRESV